MLGKILFYNICNFCFKFHAYIIQIFFSAAESSGSGGEAINFRKSLDVPWVIDLLTINLLYFYCNSSFTKYKNVLLSIISLFKTAWLQIDIKFHENEKKKTKLNH
jgi:hypothetical protein